MTVTDPAGKWKKQEVDALGNLVKVTEPKPGGGEYESTYIYNLRGQMTQAVLVRDGATQTRTFAYDLTTGRLQSETLPETGTSNYYWNTVSVR